MCSGSIIYVRHFGQILPIGLGHYNEITCKYISLFNHIILTIISHSNLLKNIITLPYGLPVVTIAHDKVPKNARNAARILSRVDFFNSSIESTKMIIIVSKCLHPTRSYSDAMQQSDYSCSNTDCERQ